MILFAFILAGILIGLLANWRHGKKNDFQGISRIHGLWLPIAGVLLHGSFSFLPNFALHYAGIITCTGYLCIFSFLFLNRKKKLPIAFMAAGSLSNFSVIAANGFRMPVSPASLAMYPGMTAEAVYARRVNYFIAQNGAHLYFLGDIIPVPLRTLGGFISVGDLLLGFGLLLFIVWVLTEAQGDDRNEDLPAAS